MMKKLRKPWNIHETFDVKQASLDNFQNKMGFSTLESSKVLVKSNCPTDLLSRQKKQKVHQTQISRTSRSYPLHYCFPQQLVELPQEVVYHIA